MGKKEAHFHTVLSKGLEQNLPCRDMTGRPVFAAEVKGQGRRTRDGVKGNRKGHEVKPVQIHGTLSAAIVSTLQQVDVTKGTET